MEKKAPYAVEARGLLAEIQKVLGIPGVTGVRILNRYDVEGLDPEAMERCKPIVFMEPPLDQAYDRLPQGEHAALAVEALPGQFDPRAASCEECVQLLTGGELPRVAAAKVYLFSGAMTPEDFARIKDYLINPGEAREADLSPKKTLALDFQVPRDVPILAGFRELEEAFRILWRTTALPWTGPGLLPGLFPGGKAEPQPYGAAGARHLLVRSLPPHHLWDGAGKGPGGAPGGQNGL